MSKEMKTLTINGNKYEVVDEYSREHDGNDNNFSNESVSGTIKLELEDGKFNPFKICYDKYLNSSAYIKETDFFNIYEVTCPSNTNIVIMGKNGISDDNYIEIYETNTTSLKAIITGYFPYDRYVRCTILSQPQWSLNNTYRETPLTQIDYYMNCTDGQITTKVYEYATKEDLISQNYELYPVTLNDVTKNTLWYLSDADATVGGSMDDKLSHVEQNGHHCTFQCKVNKGDMIIFTNSHKMTSGVPNLVVADESGTIVENVTYDEVMYNSDYILEPADTDRIGGAYKFKHSGTLYMCFIYTNVQSGEFFYLKKSHPSEPLVLSENGLYEEDTTWGDTAMRAIMEGKQILVRLNNADGGKYTALYSPIMNYQLPNYQNEYLYLFFLKDAKQDFSSILGLPDGTALMPTYGQLKLKLSHTYNQTPLL